jgi:hypothetical protein
MTNQLPAGSMVVGRTLRFYARGRIVGGTGGDTIRFTFKYGNFTLYSPSNGNNYTLPASASTDWNLMLTLTCLSTTTATACTFGPTNLVNYQYGRIEFGSNSITTTTTMTALGLRHHGTANTLDTFDNTIANNITFTVDLNAAGSSLVGSVDCSEVTIEILN